MSRKYKFGDSDKLYFISYAVVYWMDIFTREEYNSIWIESIKYCQREKGLEVYGWCLMSSHAHLIIGSEKDKLENIVRDMKKFTSEKIREAIQVNKFESRREWITWMFKRAASKNSNNNEYQVWQQNNNPILIQSPEMFNQKLNYIHNNPVEAGFVNHPAHWKYSSAIDFYGGKGLIELEYC
jgi:REP element-mobilizing transposase RayT